MSQFNQITITDDNLPWNNQAKPSYRSEFVPATNNPPVYENVEDMDYTQYTANSAMEDSFELDSQA